MLHHLYSRAPPALESPHTRSGLTPAQVRGSRVRCALCPLLAKRRELAQHGWYHGPARIPLGSHMSLHLPLSVVRVPSCPRVQYSLWLDGHSQEETLKFIRTALEACAAKAKGAEGTEQLLPLLRRLSASS